MVVAGLFLAAFLIFIGWCAGNSKKGFMVHKTNELPMIIFTVVYTDKICTVLRGISSKQEYFLVTTKAFAGQPIRAKDQVRTILTDKERKNLKLPVLGYPPLIKVEKDEESSFEDLSLKPQQVDQPLIRTLEKLRAE